MKRLALFALAAAVVGYTLAHAPLAHAGEDPIGRIVVTDGGTATNRCNGTTAFDIGANVKLTVQCDAAAYIQTNATTAPATTALKIATADQMFPTSVGAQQSRTCYGPLLADAGVNPTTYYGGHLAVAPVSGASLTCKVFTRAGTE